MIGSQASTRDQPQYQSTDTATTASIAKLSWKTGGNFVENKFGPIPGQFKEWMKGETFGGEKPTLSNTAIELFSPLGMRNAWKDSDEPGRANLLMIMILDGLGIASNTY